MPLPKLTKACRKDLVLEDKEAMASTPDFDQSFNESGLGSDLYEALAPSNELTLLPNLPIVSQ
jgi:hypothetical protein